MSYNESDNDYKLLGTDFKNFNGAYNNFNMSVGLAYKFNPKANLNFIVQVMLVIVCFLVSYQTRQEQMKIQDFNNRNLLVYNYHNTNFNHEL